MITWILIVLFFGFVIGKSEITLVRLSEARDCLHDFRMWVILNGLNNYELMEIYHISADMVMTFDEYWLKTFYFGSAIREEYRDLLINKTYMKR